MMTLDGRLYLFSSWVLFICVTMINSKTQKPLIEQHNDNEETNVQNNFIHENFRMSGNQERGQNEIISDNKRVVEDAFENNECKHVFIHQFIHDFFDFESMVIKLY